MGQKLVKLLIIFLALGGLTTMAWYAHDHYYNRQIDEDIPLLKVETGPFKVEPDDPGGMEVPYKDKVIYEAIRSNDDVESDDAVILPEAEEPVERDVITSQIVDEHENAGLESDIANTFLNYGGTEIQCSKADTYRQNDGAKENDQFANCQ